MAKINPIKIQKIIDIKTEELNKLANEYILSSSLESNISIMKKLFIDDDTIVYRYIENDNIKGFRCCLVYSKTLIDKSIIDENVIKPLMLTSAVKKENVLNTVKNKILQVDSLKEVDKVEDIIFDITYGDSVLFIENVSKVLILNTKSFTLRAIKEPDAEKTLNGPREGFNESLLTNLSLVRRKLRTNELKMKYITLGRKTKTQVCVCYVDSIVNKDILKEVYRRINTIDIDGVLDANYISEMIKDNKFSLFRTTGYTEKPDTVVSKLLEGRIAIFVDGSPNVMTVPFLFVENFQSSEDYYLNYYYASISRLLRYLGFFLTLIIPGFYIAIVAFHHEMLPTQLFINIATERQSVPLPAALEAFIMLIVFDILRESGIRMPSSLGQALSTVGALIIGQAAVEAKLVAAPMIIVVAITGISGLLVPKLNESTIIIRTLLLLCASIMGLFGLALGVTTLLIHIINLKSFGVSQLTPIGSLNGQKNKDIFIRAPWWKMTTRTEKISPNRNRLNVSGDK